MHTWKVSHMILGNGVSVLLYPSARVQGVKTSFTTFIMWFHDTEVLHSHFILLFDIMHLMMQVFKENERAWALGWCAVKEAPEAPEAQALSLMPNAYGTLDWVDLIEKFKIWKSHYRWIHSWLWESYEKLLATIKG